MREPRLVKVIVVGLDFRTAADRVTASLRRLLVATGTGASVEVRTVVTQVAVAHGLVSTPQMGCFERKRARGAELDGGGWGPAQLVSPRNENSEFG
jgi:hypothetical protein